jgi:hypothetical protein
MLAFMLLIFPPKLEIDQSLKRMRPLIRSQVSAGLILPLSSGCLSKQARRRTTAVVGAAENHFPLQIILSVSQWNVCYVPEA